MWSANDWEREPLLEWGLFERRSWNDINCCDAGAFISWVGSTAGASEEVSQRRNALFRNYGTRMFLLLFAVYFMVKVLDVRVPTNLEGFSFSLSFVRPSPHTANQLFSGVRFSPPTPDALVTVYPHYPWSTTHSTIIFNNSYCIFLLSLNKKNFTFPILFISGWQNNPTVIWNVFIFDSTCFCCWMIGLRLNGTAGCNLSWPCVKNQNRKKKIPRRSVTCSSAQANYPLTS